jgi:hypothetical protein
MKISSHLDASVLPMEERVVEDLRQVFLNAAPDRLFFRLVWKNWEVMETGPAAPTQRESL